MMATVKKRVTSGEGRVGGVVLSLVGTERRVGGGAEGCLKRKSGRRKTYVKSK